MQMNKDEAMATVAEYHQIAAKIAVDHNLGDVLNFSRSKELIAAHVLGHRLADDLPGADAFDGEKPLEYKSTTAKTCKGTYSGISVQPTWEEQVEYLKDKILKYEHYINRFEEGVLVESWHLSGQAAYNILLPKLKKAHTRYLELKKKKKENQADPRLSAGIYKGELMKHGTKVDLKRGVK